MKAVNLKCSEVISLLEELNTNESVVIQNCGDNLKLSKDETLGEIRSRFQREVKHG